MAMLCGAFHPTCYYANLCPRIRNHLALLEEILHGPTCSHMNAREHNHQNPCPSPFSLAWRYATEKRSAPAMQDASATRFAFQVQKLAAMVSSRSQGMLGGKPFFKRPCMTKQMRLACYTLLQTASLSRLLTRPQLYGYLALLLDGSALGMAQLLHHAQVGRW